MIDVAQLKIGDKVHYTKNGSTPENGMVKEIHDIHNVRVVYHCEGKWKDFMKYTSALTPIDYLHKGWNHEV